LKKRDKNKEIFEDRDQKKGIPQHQIFDIEQKSGL